MDELLPVEPVRPPGPARRRLLIAVTLVLLVAFVVVAGLEGSGFIIRSEPPPVVEPTPDPATTARLAYVGVDGALHVIDAGGSTTVDLPSGGAEFGLPAWSPDGARIAAIATDSRSAHLDVFTPPAAGSGDAPSGPTTVYDSAIRPVFYAYWAPDSRALAFLTTEPDGIALRRALADASASATVIRTGAPMYWQWIDPARLLVHSGGTAADAFAGEVGLDGTPAASEALAAGAFRSPAISRDGTHVAFSTTAPDGTMAVVVAAPDGSGRHEVPVFSASAFEFDPNGETLAFTASADAGASADLPVGPLRAIDPGTGTVRTLLDGSVVTFFWAPDGRTIAAISIPGPGDTKVASANGPRITLARAGPGAVDAAAGVTLRLAFVDAASGSIRSARDIELSDLFVNQVLPYFDQYALSHRFWSPDSRSIALPVIDALGASRITGFFADGSDPVVLADGTSASWSP